MTAAHVIEAMLLRANESHTKAGTTRTVTLLLPNDGPHPFAGLACGPDNGQRMAISIALIGDDETQAAPEPVQKERRKFDELKRSQQAGMLCEDQRFIQFLKESWGLEIDITDIRPVEEQVAQRVRDICGVRSRSEFDTSNEDAADWDTLYAEYVEWQKI